MSLSVLTGVELGAEFDAMVDAIAKSLPTPVYRHPPVVLDDLPSPSAPLDLVRLAVIAALERVGQNVQVLPAVGRPSHLPEHGWLITGGGVSPELTYRDGQRHPAERRATLAEDGDGVVRVTAGEARFEFRPPSEQECRRLLESGARGTALRFPVFPSAGPSLIARGEGPDELVLWRFGLPATAFRLPGPVLAATYVSCTISESLIALIEIDGELVVHAEGDQDSSFRKLRLPIGFSVRDEAEHDLSPLYLHAEEHWDNSVHFRRAGQWWRFLRYSVHTTLEPSPAHVHGPSAHPFHTRLDGPVSAIYGPGHSSTASHGLTWGKWERWKVWGVDDPLFIAVPPGEDVVGLTRIGDEPALLTRDGDLVRARTRHDVRTVVEFGGPLVVHHHLPWVAVQRSAHLVEVLDVATGAVLHRLDTA